MVGAADLSCHPAKVDMEEELDVSAMTVEEAARRVPEPMDVRTIPRLRRD